MNSRLNPIVMTGDIPDISEDAIIRIYNNNQKNAKRSKLVLSMATLLGIYIVLATLVLVRLQVLLHILDH